MELRIIRRRLPFRTALLIRKKTLSLVNTKRRDTVVGSLDVKALYPSLDQMGSSRIVAEFVKDKMDNISGIDWRHAQVFIASNMDTHKFKKEGVMSLVPSHLNKFGPRPGPTTNNCPQKKHKRKNLDDCQDDAEKQVKTKWTETDVNMLSDRDKRLLLSVVFLIATRLVFKHHCYSFNGNIFRQSRGGPIGLRFTSIVAPPRHGQLDQGLHTQDS